MLLLINKLYSKLENHQHHKNKQEALTASLQEFRSDVSDCMNRVLSLNLKPGFEILSLPWIQHCFQILPMIYKAFAKLVVNIDCHFTKWKFESMQAYLDYSLNLLDLLNSISSSLSHWTQFRISMTHALSLGGCSSPSLSDKQPHLKAIGSKTGLSQNNFKTQEENKEDKEDRSCSDEEKIICKALKEVESITFLVSSIVLCGLSGDATAYLEMRESAQMHNSSLINLDSTVCKEIKERGCLLKEAKELNEAAAAGKSYGDAEEAKKRSEEFGKQIDELGKDVDGLFSQVLAGRSQLLDSIRHLKE